MLQKWIKFGIENRACARLQKRLYTRRRRNWGHHLVFVCLYVFVCSTQQKWTATILVCMWCDGCVYVNAATLRMCLLCEMCVLHAATKYSFLCLCPTFAIVCMMSVSFSVSFYSMWIFCFSVKILLCVSLKTTYVRILLVYGSTYLSCECIVCE